MYSCHLFLISSASVRSIPFLSFIVPHLCRKCSLGISNFLDENSSLSHSMLFLYFFALIHKIHRRMTEKDLYDPDKHNGVITHLEPDILVCKVKWALGSITMNKVSGGDEIPVELFQILKDDVWKCCTQYASKSGKLSSGHRTGKGQFSFQSQRKATPKNVQSTAQLYSYHILVK